LIQKQLTISFFILDRREHRVSLQVMPAVVRIDLAGLPDPSRIPRQLSGLLIRSRFWNFLLLELHSPNRGREHRLVHISEGFNRIKDNTAVAIFNRITFPVLHRKFS
jgi:hypothetical protein